VSDESVNPAQLAARDRSDARFADVSAQVRRKLGRTYRTEIMREPGPSEEKAMELWSLWVETIDDDAIRMCPHPTDRYYWIIDEDALGCEMCWDFYRAFVGPSICLDHTCRSCGRHEPWGMVYSLHLVVFTIEVGPDAEESPVILIPFMLCAACEEAENAMGS
jgi:hypothetical protein